MSSGIPDKYKDLLGNSKPSRKERNEARAALRAERRERASSFLQKARQIKQSNKQNRIVSWTFQKDYTTIAAMLLVSGVIVNVVLNAALPSKTYWVVGAAVSIVVVAYLVLVAGNLAFLHDMKYVGLKYDKDNHVLVAGKREAGAPKRPSAFFLNQHYHKKFWCPPSRDMLDVTTFIRDISPADEEVAIPAEVVSLRLLHHAVGAAARKAAGMDKPDHAPYLLVSYALTMHQPDKAQRLRLQEIATVSNSAGTSLGRTFVVAHRTSMTSKDYSETVTIPWDIVLKLYPEVIAEDK